MLSTTQEASEPHRAQWHHYTQLPACGTTSVPPHYLAVAFTETELGATRASTHVRVFLATGTVGTPGTSSLTGICIPTYLATWTSSHCRQSFTGLGEETSFLRLVRPRSCLIIPVLRTEVFVCIIITEVLSSLVAWLLAWSAALVVLFNSRSRCFLILDNVYTST